MTKILNAILQMAYLKLYIPLSMLITSALLKIHMNNSLKYDKIPFGNGVGHQSLDKSIFPPENSLYESLFLQPYLNWSTIIDIVLSPDVSWVVQTLLKNAALKFSDSFEAWHDMGRQLLTQFIENPFILDPASQHTFSSSNVHEWTLFSLRSKKLINKVGCMATAHFEVAAKILVTHTAALHDTIPMTRSPVTQN